MLEKKKIVISLGLCLSSICDRGCSHCDANATMNGRFFSPEDALLLTKELRKKTKTLKKYDIHFSVQITGDGESLINPDFVQIFDIIFGLCPNITGHIMTSGINSLEEEKRLTTLINRPYAKRLDFCLSFNLFQKNSSSRVLKTLAVLFENGIESVHIKICQTYKRVFRTISRLNKILYEHFIKWVREIQPIIDGQPAFYPVDLDKELGTIIEDLCDLDLSEKPETIIKAVQSALVNTLAPEKNELDKAKVFLQTRHVQTFAFKTSFGEKKIIYFPSLLSKRGRAKNLPDPGSFVNLHCLCPYLATRENHSEPHIGSDGIYYPCCDCPPEKSLQLGHISDDLGKVIGFSSAFKEFLLRQIIIDKTNYTDICDHCVKAANKLAQKIGGSPMEIIRGFEI